MDRFAHLETFIAVAEAASFSDAADRLGLSRAVCSKHVQLLEDRLGVKLMQRTTRRVRLTEAGLRYLERAQRLMADFTDADIEVRGETVEPRGTLRVNAPVSFGWAHLAPLVAKFTEAYPALRVDLTLNDRRVDLIEEGFDVAIRIGVLEDSSLMARPLAPVKVVLAAAPRHIARHGLPQRPEDLADHACLCYRYAAHGDVWKLRHVRNGSEEQVRVSGPIHANNGDALAEAAIAGAGIIQQPLFIQGRALEDKRLIRILPDWEPEPLRVHAVHHQSLLAPAKLRVFIDFLATEMRARTESY